MRQQYIRWVIMWLMVISVYAQAALKEAVPYYSADVAVPDKSSVVWHDAVADALRAVLVKVSGNSAINTLRPVDALGDAVDHMVQQFSYKNQVDLQGNKQLMLQVNFDIEMVDGVLERLEQPIWSGKRPRTLVWFMVSKEGKNLFLTDAEPESTWFIDNAKTRGVQVLFPTHDLAYNTVLDMPIEAPEMLAQLRAFSHAYPHEQLLIGQQLPGEDEVTWKLIVGEEEYLWTDQAADLPSAIQNGIYHMVDDMVAHHAVFQEKSMEGVVHMAVSRVHTLSAYQQLLESLRHNPVVSRFHLSSIAQDVVTVEVVAKGDVDALSDALARQNTLRMVTDPAAYDQVELAYQWVEK
jgi:hypothetical protein